MITLAQLLSTHDGDVDANAIESYIERVYPYGTLKDKINEKVLDVAKENFLNKNFENNETNEIYNKKIHELLNKIESTQTEYVPTSDTSKLMKNMLQDFLIGKDLSMVGPKGSGDRNIYYYIFIFIIFIYF